ncbi:MAG: FemAB family XrtA/PEP-CTERM system-associated protein [Pseudomonadota bacterium]
MTITIEEATEKDAAAWDAYVQENPAATFFHRSGWARVIASAYGYASPSLIARRGQEIAGLVPLTFVNSPLTGKALISTAFTVGGGILADDEKVAEALGAAALARGADLGVNFVELRGGHGGPPQSGGAWHARSGFHAGFCLNIPGADVDLLKIVPRKRRAEIRKSLALLDQGALQICEQADAKRFLTLYRASLHTLGTPVFPFRFLDALCTEFRDAIAFTTILHNERPVVSLLSFQFRNEILPYYVGAVPQARALRAFDLAYWHQLCRAQEKGLTLFDFGRSKIDSGSFGYKKTWGITPEPLTYLYGLVHATEVPQINVSNPRYALASRVWQRLPLPVATFGGSLLARHFA